MEIIPAGGGSKGAEYFLSGLCNAFILPFFSPSCQNTAIKSATRKSQRRQIQIYQVALTKQNNATDINVHQVDLA